MEPVKNTPPQNKMATVPVGKLMLSMSLPLMLSMIMEALYNVVDSLFIARVSENALAALSLAFPIQLLVVSISVGTGAGVNAALSRLLGEKDQKGVNDVADNSVFIALLTSVIFLIFGLFFAGPYFTSQTTDPEIIRLGVDYLAICMIFSFGSVGQIIFQRLLQSTGKTMLSMVSQLVGAVINVILDPILIFGYFGFPAMGVKGAAISTVVGQIVAMGIAIYFNLSQNKEIQFRFRGFKPNWGMIGTIYRVGAPAIVMQSLNALMGFGVNLILINISPTVVAAYGIYIKIQNFVFMPVFGLNNCVVAITAFNYGAKNKKRLNDTIKFGMLYAVAIMLIGTVVIQVFAQQILGLFDASAELTAIWADTIRVLGLTYIFVGFTTINQGVYQGLGNGLYSLTVTLLRVVIILLPVLYIFAKLFPLNIVWWAFMIAESGAAMVGAFFLNRIYAQKVAPIVQAQAS